MRIRVLLIICTINVSNQNNDNELIEDEEGCAESCTTGYWYDELGDHCYHRSGYETTWHIAEAKCKEMFKGKGGHLAAVTSREIHDLLMKKVEKRKAGQDKEENIFKIKKHYEMAVTNDLISKAKIWEKVEKKQEERRQRSEHEQEKQDLIKIIQDQTRKMKETFMKRRRNPEKDESKVKMNSKKERPSLATRYDRQTRTSSLEYEDDEIYELTQVVDEMLKTMKDPSKLQEANLEIVKLKAEVKYLKEMNSQKDVQINRFQTNSSSIKGPKGILKLQEDNMKMKEDLQAILQRLPLEAATDERDRGRSQREIGSILI